MNQFDSLWYQFDGYLAASSFDLTKENLTRMNYIQDDLKDFCRISLRKVFSKDEPIKKDRVSAPYKIAHKPSVDLRVYLNANNEIKYGETLKIECLSHTGLNLSIFEKKLKLNKNNIQMKALVSTGRELTVR